MVHCQFPLPFCVLCHRADSPGPTPRVSTYAFLKRRKTAYLAEYNYNNTIDTQSLVGKFRYGSAPKDIVSVFVRNRFGTIQDAIRLLLALGRSRSCRV